MTDRARASRQQVTAQRSHWWVTAAGALTSLVLNLDQATVLLAAPTIAEALGADLSATQWMFSGFLLPLAALVMLGGGLTDRFGASFILRCGLALFIAGTVGSAFADGMGLLIGLRAVSGMGAALAFPASVALLRVHLPAGRPLNVALGLWFTGALGGSAIGPLIGGLLLRAWPWWSIFWLSCGFALAALVPVLIGVRDDPAPTTATDLRVLPSLAGSVGLALLIWGLISAGGEGWGSGSVLWRMLGGLGVLALMTAALRRGATSRPDSGIDRRRLAGGLVIMLLAIVSVVGTMFFVITYLQSVLGFSPLVAGAAFMPFGVVAALISPFAMRLLERFGFGRMLGSAVLAEVAGLVLISRMTPTSPYPLVGIALALVGAAMSVFPAVSLHLALSAAPSSRGGIVSGAHTVAIQLGQLLSIAIIGSLVASRVGGIHRSLLGDAGLDPDVPTEITTDLALGRSAAPPGVSEADGLLYEIAGEKAFTTAVGQAALIVLVAIAVAAVAALAVLRPKREPSPAVSGTEPSTAGAPGVDR